MSQCTYDAASPSPAAVSSPTSSRMSPMTTVGPVGDEVLGDLPADAARRPGDHRDAVRKVESVVHHPLS